ncbi:hypothetical protein S40285_09943 [Stachybotrys chlorohalonatus IBT 40285]|uniref:EthD domain-containing protein n=1 Tax=Stachybotrys chlorohalonatus (strain IBT 40285) TaxID=1283841 RepID=A0A084QHB0_STAC4|nr:hypothetical protein S40285_09943 [Stachybotrys chlorohalonata IBT 40285]
MAETAPLKYTVTHYRKPEHTHEEFIKWIVEVHLPLAIPIFKKHGVLEYSIVSSILPDHLSHDLTASKFTTPAGPNEALKAELGQFRPTWDFADFDCFLEYTIPDAQAIKNVMSDPDWPAAIKDQDDWVDTSKALLSLGYHTPYLLKTGEVVNMK